MEIKSLGKLTFLLVLVLAFSCCIKHSGEYPIESVPAPTKTPTETPIETPTPVETPTKNVSQIKPIVTLIVPSPYNRSYCNPYSNV